MSDRAVYRQIADEIRSGIEAGEPPLGAQLPSESELVERFEVSRLTIRRALAVLAGEGLTVSRPGIGVFVRSPPPLIRLGVERFSRRRRESGDGAFASEAKLLGRTPRQELREVGEIAAPLRIAERLGLPESAPVIVRRRRMLADGVPLQLADSYFPAEWARTTSLVQEDTGPGGSYSRVEEAGHRIARFREELVARMPSPGESRALELGAGTPVLTLTRIAYDDEGVPVEVFESIAAADKHVYVYEFAAPD